ncbi:hypothetical protein N2152v2_007906 [Parachlorella kessleri]
MDISQKDAARSKWKSTQRHKGGRGGRGGPAGRSSRPQAKDELGSNQDRYLEPEVDEHAGPVRKSQGADLAQLLEGAEAYDAGYYHRSRVNLLQEFGLPPADALSYQGLSFDLKGLAACLSLLPRNEVLMTDAFDEEGQAEAAHEPAERGSQGAAPPGEPSYLTGVEHHAAQLLQPAAPLDSVHIRPAEERWTADSAVPSGEAQRVPQHAQQAQRPLPPGTNEVACQPGEASTEPPAALPALAAPTHPAAQRPTDLASRPSADALPAVPDLQAQPPGQRAGQEAQPVQHAGGRADHDDELDFLLGLEAAAMQPQQQQQQQEQPPTEPQLQVHMQQQLPSRMPAPAMQLQAGSLTARGSALSASSSSAGVMPQMPQTQKEQSLDDWLDSL